MAESQTIAPVTAAIGSVVGAIITLLGLVLTWSPIPFGFVLLFLGLSILVWANPWVRRRVRQWRVRSQKFDAAVSAVQKRAPGPIAGALAKTEPSSAIAPESTSEVYSDDPAR